MEGCLWFGLNFWLLLLVAKDCYCSCLWSMDWCWKMPAMMHWMCNFLLSVYMLSNYTCLEYCICICLAVLGNTFSSVKVFFFRCCPIHVSQLSCLWDFRKALTISGRLVGHFPQVCRQMTVHTQMQRLSPWYFKYFSPFAIDSFQDVASLLLEKWMVWRLVTMLCGWSLWKGATENQNFMVPAG